MPTITNSIPVNFATHPITTYTATVSGINGGTLFIRSVNGGLPSPLVSASESGSYNFITRDDACEVLLTCNTGDAKVSIAEYLQTPTANGTENAYIIDCSFTKTGEGLIADEAVQIGATGSGMTVGQAYGNLLVDTGTTANSEFLMRSSGSIKGGHIARAKVILSQKIANQHFAVYLADLIGENAAFTTDATGLLISVALPSNHGFTSENIGQSCYLGGGVGAATIIPGRYAITAVSGDVITFSPTFACTWTRSTTTANVTFLGGNPIFSIAEAATVSASSDTLAIVDGAVSLLTQSATSTTSFTCLNAGATSGTLTLSMSAKAWTANASGTITVFGWNCISAVKNGTTATLTWFDSQRKGWASSASGVTTITDAIPGQMIQFSGDTTSEFFSDASPATSTSIQFGPRGSRLEGLVDSATPLYLFIQAFNGVTAPATTTRLTIGKFSMEETGINKVIIAGVSQTGSGNGQRTTVDGGTLSTVSTVSTVATVSAVTNAGTPAAPATPLIINSAATTNGQLVLTGTSGLQALYATNIGATAAFVKLYNKATAPTVGTDVPAMIIPVPAAVAGVPGVAPQISPGFNGLRFPLGLGLAITGAVADNDTTAVAAGQVKVILSRTV
jgi:hypothetical protein